MLVIELGEQADWAASAARVVADRVAAWLDRPEATCANDASCDWTRVAAEPIAVLSQRAGAAACLEVAGCVTDADPNFWHLWKRTHARIGNPSGGGPGARWIGCLGFDLAAQLERLPSPPGDDAGLPLAWLGLFDIQIAADMHSRRTWALFDPRPASALGVDPAGRGAVFDALLARWRVAADSSHGPVEPVEVVAPPRALHEAAVRRALDYIAAGDIYQVNLAQRLEIVPARDPLRAFLEARSGNPAAYRAFIRCGDAAVTSFSPELMLEVRGPCVRSSPIKGTRPRGGDAAQDRALIEELLGSPKDAAELAMIVDLHRNDLGRVCKPHSVRVEAARRAELHPSVIHTVADIRGELRGDCGAIDALAASFPAGSISGVPKIRALEIIRELEPSPRGLYTGAIGWMDLAGDACWSVAIRIVQFGRRRTVIHVGGGIVAESDPAAEYEETRHKARAILEGLGVASTGAALAGHRA